MRIRNDEVDVCKKIKRLGDVIRKHNVEVGSCWHTTDDNDGQYENYHIYNSNTVRSWFGPKYKRKYTSTISQRLQARAELWKISIFSRDRRLRKLALQSLKQANAERRRDIAVKVALCGIAAFFILPVYSIYRSSVQYEKVKELSQREIQRQEQLKEYYRDSYLRDLQHQNLEKRLPRDSNIPSNADLITMPQ
ncbi:MAG: hypothetical protein JW837_00050 [Sedimentisphaerales bacterium]|nr:hypothetical protein [Sedimentisphaerales bacterium]